MLMSIQASYFQLVAADRLRTSLKTAIRFALRVWSEGNPRIRLLLKYEDEFILVISALVDWTSLWRNAATSSEALYGIARRDAQSETDARPSSMQLMLSAISIVALPYIQSRLDKLHDDVVSHRSSLRAIFPNQRRQGLTLKELVVRIFLKSYPYGRFSADVLSWGYQFLYLVGHSEFYTPVLQLLNLRQFSLSPEEIVIHTEAEEKAVMLARMISLNQIRDAVSHPVLRLLLENGLRSYHFLSDNFKKALIALIFAFKALEWWYLVGEERAKESARLPIPPPPPPPPPHPDGIQLPENRPDLCPICRCIRVNPTQLTVSGYVFCYRCIVDYITENSSCPVTLIPANLLHLRRLYKGSTSI